MRLVYGLLCDYAAPGNVNKPTVLGIFDAYIGHRPTPADQIRTPQCCIHARIDALAHEGPRHLFGVRLVDPDGHVVHEEEHQIGFISRLDGLGLLAFIYASVGPVTVPDFGTYEWAIFIDGIMIGAIPLSIVDATLLPNLGAAV